MKHTVTPLTAQPLQHVATFLREGFITLNPAQMGVILRECQYERQRKIDQRHVAVLSEMMRRGLWEAKDKLDFARLNGRLILVNGYHRTHAQLASGKNIEWTVAIHECDTPEDVQRLYYRFDTNLRKRSDQAILGGIDFAAETNLPTGVATNLYRAVPLIANNLRPFSAGGSKQEVFTRRIVDDRLDLAREYVPAALALAEALKPAPAWLRKKIANTTTYAVALVTMRARPETGMEFWGGMALNDGLRRSDPRATLIADLADRNFHNGSLGQGLVVPALAWNAHWDHRDLKIIKVVPNRAVRLLGTAYTVTA